MRYRAIYDKHGDKKYEFVDGVCVFARDEMPEKVTVHHVMPDIQPYQSMKTGEMITSREQHREHLAKYNLTEIGNDTSYLIPPKPDLGDSERKEFIRYQIDMMREDDLRKAVKNDLEYARWNSRGVDGAR